MSRVSTLSRRSIDAELALLLAAPQLQCAASVLRCEALLANHQEQMSFDETLYVLRVGASGCQAAGRWLDGLRMAQRGVDLATLKHKLPDKIAFLAIIGNVHSFLGNVHLAIRAMHEAIFIAEQEHLVEDQVKLSLGLGPMYGRLNLFDTALSVYQRGYELATTGNFPSLRIGALNNMAGTYREMGQLEAAEREIVSALQLAAAHPGSHWLPYLFHTNAEIQAARGRLNEAVAEAKRAVALLRAQSNVPVLLRVLIDGASWLTSLGNHDMAGHWLQEAGLLPQEKSLYELRKLLALARIRLERESRRPASALLAFDDYLTARADGEKIRLEGQRIATQFVEDLKRSEAQGRRESAAVNDLTLRLIETQAEAHRIARQSARDSLTGALNRAAFDAAADRAAGAQLQQPVALVMLDIDNFRDVNSLNGHPAGDTVLKVVVERMRQALRTNDLLSRYGGDEFLFLCPGVGPRTAAVIANRVLQCIAAEPVVHAGHRINVTASLGVACTQTSRLASLPYLVKRADTALRRAKLAGKNRSVIVRVNT